LQKRKEKKRRNKITTKYNLIVTFEKKKNRKTTSKIEREKERK
jgi:hypothetical protein